MDVTMHCIVKGNKEATELACKKRGMVCKYLRYVEDCNWSVCHITGEFREIERWFCSSGLEVGALLHYRELQS
jgi:hypothetical protein